MNRQQFLEQLEAELSGLAPVERQEALKFYVEYLDEAGPENEAAVLAELGSPQKVAAIIRANLGLSDESAAPHETPKPSLTLNGPDWSRKTEQQAQSGAPGAGSAAYGGQPFPKSKTTAVCCWFCCWFSQAPFGSAYWGDCSARLWGCWAAFWGFLSAAFRPLQAVRSL